MRGARIRQRYLLRAGSFALRLNNRQRKVQVHPFGLIEAEQLLRDLTLRVLVGSRAASDRACDRGAHIGQFIALGHTGKIPGLIDNALIILEKSTYDIGFTLSEPDESSIVPESG